jgi:CubicO group peptidase (beta-lactamase class C family)
MSRGKIRKSILFICVSLLILASLSAAESQSKECNYWPTKGWRTSTPEAQGMRSDILADMLSRVQEKGYRIDSITVVRNGLVVADAYFYPFQRGMKHSIHSCTKSIISLLVGIALDKGYIKDIHQSALSFFPHKTIANLDERKKAITIKNLLTMSSGLKCRDSYRYGYVGYREMLNSQDWIQHVLDLPMETLPGHMFNYCNGVSHLLSGILQHTTNITTLEFAKQHLFTPLGITDVEWQTSPQGIYTGWARMSLTPHDMAKIGWLSLNKGQWEGKQIVSKAWVRESTKGHMEGKLSDIYGGTYGYQWWVDPAGYYMAIGFQGQFIFVIPEKNIITVFTSTLSSKEMPAPGRLLTKYILPAAVSSGPLPANPKANERLNSIVSACSQAQGCTWTSESDGVGINGVFKRTASPAFQFSYPDVSRKDEITYPTQIMGMRTPDGMAIHAYLSEIPTGLRLAEVGPKAYTEKLAQVGTDIKTIANREIVLRDGSRAYRTDFEWQFSAIGSKVTTRLVSAFKDGQWIHVATHHLIDPGDEAPIVESLTLQ